MRSGELFKENEQKSPELLPPCSRSWARNSRTEASVTHDDFRRIALGMKDAAESAHMDHPDFRVSNRIFATLHADNEWGMVILTPDQQQRFVQEAPKAFVPEKGAWGLQGCTAVRLDIVDEELLGEAMTLAWRNRVEKSAAGGSKGKSSAGKQVRTRKRRAGE